METLSEEEVRRAITELVHLVTQVSQRHVLQSEKDYHLKDQKQVSLIINTYYIVILFIITNYHLSYIFYNNPRFVL